MAQQSTLQEELGSPSLSSRRRRVSRRNALEVMVFSCIGASRRHDPASTLFPQEISRELSKLDAEQADILQEAKKQLLQS